MSYFLKLSSFKSIWFPLLVFLSTCQKVLGPEHENASLTVSAKWESWFSDTDKHKDPPYFKNSYTKSNLQNKLIRRGTGILGLQNNSCHSFSSPPSWGMTLFIKIKLLIFAIAYYKNNPTSFLWQCLHVYFHNVSFNGIFTSS